MEQIKPQLYSSRVHLLMASKWLLRSLSKTKEIDFKNDLLKAIEHVEASAKNLEQIKIKYEKNLAALAKLLNEYKKKVDQKNLREIQDKIKSLFYELGVLYEALNILFDNDFKLLMIEQNKLLSQ